MDCPGSTAGAHLDETHAIKPQVFSTPGVRLLSIEIRVIWLRPSRPLWDILVKGEPPLGNCLDARMTSACATVKDTFSFEERKQVCVSVIYIFPTKMTCQPRPKRSQLQPGTQGRLDGLYRVALKGSSSTLPASSTLNAFGGECPR